jgi:arylsulfatase A-like enzyme
VAVAAAIVLAAALQLWRAPTRRPDVFLVTVDTLRADSLGCYGRVGAGTHAFDRIAREGVLFEDVLAPMPLTRPSHFSIMTSQPPRSHGVVNNSLTLPNEAVTLPELFRAAGYDTIGSVAVKLLGPESGAAQGFDAFDAPSEPPRWPGSDALEHVATRLAKRADGRPVFAWLHVFEPHIPYVSHREPASEPSEISWPMLLDVAARNQGAIPAAVFNRARQLYEEEVTEADRVLGGLLQLLDRSDTPTLLAVTADHGECFENGVFFEHADCLHESALRVPLLLRFPGHLKPDRRRDAVELRLLGPTLLRLAGLERPTSFDRATLLEPAESPIYFESPVLTSEAAANADALTVRHQEIRQVAGQPVRPLTPFVPQFGVRWQRWKYVVAGDLEELFDLRLDPLERQNVAFSRREVADEMRRLQSTWLREHPLKSLSESAAGPELQETLRSLGYLR